VTPAGVPDDLAAEVARSRHRQGLPPTVEDPETLAKVAILLADVLSEAGPEQARSA
jgi:hypothetical protein